jgi:putative oxidoreductase
MMSGLGKLAAYGPTVQHIGAAGLPLPPLAYAAAVAIELGGGILLVLGYQARAAAAAQVLFAVLAAAFFHAHFADQNQMIHFLKNLMMAGGLLQIVYFGAGPWSLDNRLALAPGRSPAPERSK